jgi:type VI secretion system protein ImpL
VKRIFNWWTLTLLAAVVVVVCLAFVLPIFVHFLRPWWVRLLIVLLVFGIWGGFALARVLSARAADAAIAKELAAPAPGDAEVATLSGRMAEALASLRSASGGRRDYLYSRPWYVIIGPPGAGKTTALVNSGLRFPYSDTALKGVGGTRNLDFWFADEAALVDTAGRYTTQDSDAPADARAWEGFLKLLRRHRPLAPINGVIVAIGVDELLRSNLAGLDAHATAVRRRLAEIRRTLEVSVPVYVLFTKADLLAGFVEYFDDLDVEGRRAVLGATLPMGRAPEAGALAEEYDLFVQSVADRDAKRLQEEPDARRRGLVLGFPAQLETLRPRVIRFLEGAFLHGGEPVGALRGFYLASGVQQGAPLDRLLGEVAQVFDQAPSAQGQGQGRAYFLNRLLTEVIIPEAGLVQDDPTARARRRTALIGGLVGVGAVVLLTLVLWAVSFTGNRGLQGKALAAATNAKAELQAEGVDLVEVKASDPDLEQTLAVLRALRNIPGGYEDRVSHHRPITQTFGLYQSGQAREAEQAYLQGLQRILLPRVLLRLEAFMQEHKSDPLALYEALKVYLILGGQGPWDPDAVKSWVEADWANSLYPGADRLPEREELGKHLEAMLSQGQPSSVWPDRQTPLDGGLIITTRQTVQTLSLGDRAYAILRQKALSQGAPWSAAAVLDAGSVRAFANPDAVLHMSVPFFYTRGGYDKAYLAGLPLVQEDLQKDSWVMGSDASTVAIRSQMAGVSTSVAAAYARDYIAAWQGVIKALAPANYFADPTAFAAFTGTPSPLKILLLEVKKNTTFTGGASGLPGASLLAGVNKAVSSAEKLGGVGAAGSTVDAAQQITLAFKDVDAYADKGVDDFVSSVKTAFVANTTAAGAGGGLAATATQGQMATAVGDLKTKALTAPPMLQAFATSAAEGGTKAQVTAAQGAVADAYKQQLAPVCQATVTDRYPFIEEAASDAAVSDMLRVFGANGAFDNFTRDRLGPLLDRVGPVWRWNVQDPVGAALDPPAAEDFQKADAIKELLTTGLPMQVQGAGFGGAVTAVEISSGGVTDRFDAGSAGGP